MAAFDGTVSWVEQRRAALREHAKRMDALALSADGVQESIAFRKAANWARGERRKLANVGRSGRTFSPVFLATLREGYHHKDGRA